MATKRSPDLTLYDIFIWGYVKSIVFTPLMPKTLQELNEFINVAMGIIDNEILQNVWNELDYR